MSWMGFFLLHFYQQVFCIPSLSMSSESATTNVFFIFSKPHHIAWQIIPDTNTWFNILYISNKGNSLWHQTIKLWAMKPKQLAERFYEALERMENAESGNNFSGWSAAATVSFNYSCNQLLILEYWSNPNFI